jgi:hypothetical protein
MPNMSAVCVDGMPIIFMGATRMQTFPPEVHLWLSAVCADGTTGLFIWGK